ncbi:MAG: hypothetical protein K9M80_08915, partial [Candidatus Marinimicrobia bacterium]|nr:hypothetical protein [Candidatus Neomarinimicrobiota bacterium]
FARAYGNLKQDHKLIDHAALLSQKIGRGAIPGIVRKMFKRLVISTATLENNNLLQGSIEYYRNWCNLNLCKLCPLREYAN